MTVCPGEDHGQFSGRPVADRLIMPNVQLLVHSILVYIRQCGQPLKTGPVDYLRRIGFRKDKNS